MSSEIVEKLDRLANFKAKRDVLDLEKKALIDQILTPEIKARLEEVEVEFAGRIQAVEENITTLEAEIKMDVARHGASVKGTFLRAVWNRGRVSWDTKAMDGYALEHPEILSYRKQGEPYISITQVRDL
jgi:hypothetical protein